MALTTRCPQCHAVFRVVADQLKLRGGLVRCGQCATVFDAISALSYLEDSQLKQALAPRVPPAPASRAAAPPPAPSPASAATAESAVTAAARQASIAPAMLSAAPVVARAEPVEWAHLRRAAADSPLLLGGDHAAPLGTDSQTSTSADLEAAQAAPVDQLAISARAETSTSESLSAPPTDALEIANAATPMREPALLPPAAGQESEALEALEANAAPVLDEALESDGRLESQTAPAAASEPDAEAAMAAAPSEEQAVRDAEAAPSHSNASPPPQRSEPHAEVESNDGGVALLDADARLGGPDVAQRDAESDTPSVEGAIREAGSEPYAGEVAIGGASTVQGEGDSTNRDTATEIDASHTSGSEADAATAPVEVGFLNSMAQARARRRTWLWGIGAALTAVALAWQLAAALRAEIVMRWPQAHPLLVSLCEPLGCTVEWPMQPTLLAVLASDLQAVPGTQALELDVTVRNRAPFPQALPAIELTLMDTRGQAIVRRVFTPAEYGAPPQGSLAPGADLAARVLFEVTGPAPAGFLVYPFYP